MTPKPPSGRVRTAVSFVSAHVILLLQMRSLTSSRERDPRSSATFLDV
jgi:hypothetical protein